MAVGEYDRELPFRPVRFFTVGDVPADVRRGDHATSCDELLVATAGSLTAGIHDGKNEYRCKLDRRDAALFIPRYTYCWQYDFSGDAVLLVLASEPYARVQYIERLDAFLAAVAQNRIPR